ncbi:Zn(II)2Cys6 transcription factor domain-containing protein [Aspergillus saccharolyticus JOP 1030-1]|uniref:Zn(2)-C6 fungal-type domain-containing protein n=1 Tax=Aspergillus saccharolyticus JOP 1030-1 TaxID=1450539 RepID=A0A318Z9H7_9EURO|nr:hypothetical protein BP01DRAFT_424385 [Aspergillus saccharolyticus JOP 1030-1]PYH44055.1 hypothetical protein BP01DRAFT_424385 [Aspergillus saccharolyticus JOP 1030-1]
MEATSPRRVRLACDSCHNMKMKCSGGQPCLTCTRYKHTCVYSAPHRIGRPRGSKNKAAPSPSTKDISSSAGLSGNGGKAEAWYYDQSHSPILGEENLAHALMPPVDEVIFRAPLANLPDYDAHCNAQVPSVPFSWAQSCLNDAVSNGSSAVSGLSEELYSLSSAHPPTSSHQLSQIAPDAPVSTLNTSLLSQNCNCVGVQAEALSSLRKKEADPYPIAFPIVLDATQEIQARWEALLSCAICRMDSDHVALLLLAMSLRLVLRWLQLVIHERVSLSRELSVASHSRQPSRGSTTSGMSDAPTSNVDGYQRGSTRSPFNSRSHSRSSNIFSDRIRIGNYELPKEEHDFMMNMLTSRTLGRLKQTHVGIATYFQQSQSGLNYSLTGEKKSIHLVLDHLRHSIETTEHLVQKAVQ